MIRKLTAAALGAATALVATSALAQDPAAAPAAPAPAAASASASADTGNNAGLSAAALLSYGTNNLNLGFGARVGYTLPMNLYIGGTFQYFLGESQNIDAAGDSVGVHFLIFGGEVGYELPAGPVNLRPYVGIGYVSASASLSGPNSNTPEAQALGGASSSNVGFWPGVTGLYPLGPLSVGADVRFLIVSGSNSFIPSLTAQYHF